MGFKLIVALNKPLQYIIIVNQNNGLNKGSMELRRRK